MRNDSFENLEIPLPKNYLYRTNKRGAGIVKSISADQKRASGYKYVELSDQGNRK